MTGEDYLALERELITVGFRDPFKVWQDVARGVGVSAVANYVLDGHQRLRILRELRKMGWTIPALPFDPVECTDEKDAHRQVLAFTSQYGKMTTESAFRYATNYDIKPADFGSFRLPGVEMDELRVQFEKRDENAANGGAGGAGGAPPISDDYTKKIRAPFYEPKGEKPELPTLLDTSKSDELLAEIDQSLVPEEVKFFLRAAALRHRIFNYERIAEFYCHAEPEVQELMERSALVIIDFDKAIESGFVSLSEALAEAYQSEG